jgi:hypothetical protein
MAVEWRIATKLWKKSKHLPELASLLKVVGKDVEEELRVRVGVDMPVSVRVEELAQSRGIDDVAVLLNQQCALAPLQREPKHTWAKTIP